MPLKELADVERLLSEFDSLIYRIEHEKPEERGLILALRELHGLKREKLLLVTEIIRLEHQHG